MGAVIGRVVVSPGVTTVVGTDEDGGAVTGVVTLGGGVVVASGTPRLGKVSAVGDDSSRAIVLSGDTFKYRRTPESSNKNAKSVRGPLALRRSVFAT